LENIISYNSGFKFTVYLSGPSCRFNSYILNIFKSIQKHIEIIYKEITILLTY